MRIPKLIVSLIIVTIVVACGGGGGGGGGSAGEQAVLRLVNASTDSQSLDLTLDGQPLFTGIKSGQASIYQAVQVGPHLIRVSDEGGGNLELENEFDFATPYTLIVTGSAANLRPIVAVNNRADTPPAQFRVRAINSSSKSVSVRIVPGTVGRRYRANDLKAVVATARAEPTTSATPTFIATQTPAASPSSPPILTVPTDATPTVAPTSTVVAVPSISPTVSETPPPVFDVTLGNDLKPSEIGGYITVSRGDYRIEAQTSNGTIRSGVITFSGGQILSVLVRDSNSNEGGDIQILRLDDKP